MIQLFLMQQAVEIQEGTNNMGVYAFKGIELLILMGYTGFAPNAGSPVRMAFSRVEESKSIPECKAAVADMVKNGVLKTGDDGRLRVAEELEIVMNLLLRPEIPKGVKRFGISGNTEYFVLKIGSAYGVYTSVPKEDIHICLYPMTDLFVASWFETDILAGFIPDIEQGANLDLILNPVENVLIYCAQEYYAKKAKESMPIRKHDRMFTATDILAATNIEIAVVKLKQFYTIKMLDLVIKRLSDIEAIKEVLTSMSDKGILIVGEKNREIAFCYSEGMMMFMDPVLLRDVLVISEYLPEVDLKSVYLKKNSIYILGCNGIEVSIKSIKYNELKELIR